MRLRNSFWAFIGRDVSKTPEVVIETIRNAMLLALDRNCDAGHFELHLRINFASDISALWYLRIDLMQAICSCREESFARRVLVDVTTMFQGHHSGTTQSRFSQL